jgi:hypothetical protein
MMRFVGNAKLTQRISSKFSSQLAQNDFDRVVIDRVFDHIKLHCSKDHSSMDHKGRIVENYYEDSESDDSDSDDEVEDIDTNGNLVSTFKLRGLYEMNVTIDNRKRITATHKWRDPSMKVLGINPNTFISKTVSDASIKYATNYKEAHETNIELHGYTSAVIRGVKYRATPNWKGEEWYDWACVKFPTTIDSEGGKTCICRIMGFYHYVTPGLMTFKHMEMDGLTPDDIHGLKDDTLYAILHCLSTYFSYSRLQSQFVRKFSMQPSSDMWVSPAKYIRGPVMVVPDIEDANTASSVDYMAIVPQHKSGAFFLHHVNYYVTQKESDANGEELESLANSDEVSLYGDNW